VVQGRLASGVHSVHIGAGANQDGSVLQFPHRAVSNPSSVHIDNIYKHVQTRHGVTPPWFGVRYVYRLGPTTTGTTPGVEQQQHHVIERGGVVVGDEES
jgi:hypothetical protein